MQVSVVKCKLVKFVWNKQFPVELEENWLCWKPKSCFYDEMKLYLLETLYWKNIKTSL